ncbi:MAG: hypothetical protein HYX78_12730 [Armatimonadetes bacterium]|nr:hypothetical protein [Armatimonadota bacterium]
MTNDVYRRFLVRDSSERHYVLISRVAMVVMACLGGTVAYSMNSIVGSLQLFMQLSSGTLIPGLSIWFWWRPNAVSAIVALVASASCVVAIHFGIPGWRGEDFFGHRLLITMGISTFVWFIAVMVTRPTDKEQLFEFYRRVEPPGFAWGPIERELGITKKRRGWLGQALLSWAIGIGFVYGILVAIGKLLLGSPTEGIVILVFAPFVGYVLKRRLDNQD